MEREMKKGEKVENMGKEREEKRKKERGIKIR